jgi:arylsulfatase A-like enzyme
MRLRPRRRRFPASCRSGARVLLGVAAAGTVLACGGGPEPRNLLLVSIDTLRADVLGAYGSERDTSPAMDSLAAEGILFDNVLAPSPWTLPSHASLLTGLYPSRHGVKTARNRLPGDLDTLATVLRTYGFRTAAVVNAYYLSRKYGFDRGFQDFVYVQESPGSAEPSQVEDQALRWIAEHAQEPFFLFLHYYDVHSDYRSLPRYERRFTRPYEGPADGSTRQLVRHRSGEIELGEDDAEHLKDLYAASVRQMDDGLARLRRGLEQRGLLERTVVVLTSDHGEEFLEHGGVLHGRTQYEEVVRVPLLLRAPGLPAGLRLETPVSLDVMPTVLSLLELPVPPALDGRNLAPLWSGAAAGDLRARFLFGEADHRNVRPDRTRAVRQGGFKLVHDRLTGESRLFDLVDDPGETHDVKDRHPEVQRRMRAALQDFMEREAPTAGEVPEPTPAERRRLEALGYL